MGRSAQRRAGVRWCQGWRPRGISIEAAGRQAGAQACTAGGAHARTMVKKSGRASRERKTKNVGGSQRERGRGDRAATSTFSLSSLFSRPATSPHHHTMAAAARPAVRPPPSSSPTTRPQASRPSVVANAVSWGGKRGRPLRGNRATASVRPFLFFCCRGGDAPHLLPATFRLPIGAGDGVTLTLTRSASPVEISAVPARHSDEAACA